MKLSSLVLLGLTVLTVLPATRPGRAQTEDPPAAEVRWRRTANGWERAELWNVPLEVSDPEKHTAPSPLPSTHPALVAALMFLAAALLAIGSSATAAVRLKQELARTPPIQANDLQ